MSFAALLRRKSETFRRQAKSLAASLTQQAGITASRADRSASQAVESSAEGEVPPADPKARSAWEARSSAHRSDIYMARGPHIRL